MPPQFPASFTRRLYHLVFQTWHSPRLGRARGSHLAQLSSPPRHNAHPGASAVRSLAPGASIAPRGLPHRLSAGHNTDSAGVRTATDASRSTPPPRRQRPVVQQALRAGKSPLHPLQPSRYSSRCRSPSYDSSSTKLSTKLTTIAGQVEWL